MDIESIYNISVNNIRIFLFFIEFLDTSYTCDYFSITRQHLSNVLKGIEKNFNTKIFDNNNLVNTEAFFYIKKSLYNYLINVFNILNNKILDIDIGYTELLPYRIVIDIYKKINTNFKRDKYYISFVKFQDSKILKLVYLNEILFGFVDNYPENKYLNDVGVIELKKIECYWSLYSRNQNYDKYIQFKNFTTDHLYNNKNVLIKTNNINLCLKMIENYDFMSYLPEKKLLDSENIKNILLIDKTEIVSKKYFIYNKNVTRNYLQNEVFNIIKFYE